MNEYIFFDAGLMDSFVDFATKHGLRHAVRTDAMGALVVELPDDLDDELDDAIEARYEALMDEQRELVESGEAETDARDLMGVTVTLADGEARVVRLPAAYARRLFDHFSVDEIQGLVAAIADSVLNPIDGPLCRRS